MTEPATKHDMTTLWPLWLRFASPTMLIVAVLFLLASSLLSNYRPLYSLAFVPGLVAALMVSVCLTVYSLRRFSVGQRGEEQAFRNMDCEFASIFEHTLDGIVILSDERMCLDANPAAASLLQISTSKLIGQDIRRFFADPKGFEHTWNVLQRRGTLQGQARLTAESGAHLLADFTATANYLPGRHILILCDITGQERAERSFRQSEDRFHHMANNIQEIFWMMNADTLDITYVNHAYFTITGYSLETLHENPSAYRDLIHPQDRVRVLSRLRDTARSGTFDEEFRFLRAGGTVRWVWAKGFPVLADGATRWIVGTAQDVTAYKLAQTQISEHLNAAESARAEAAVLRRATLALSQNLAMDAVLDTLLRCIGELVPFDRASVLFLESESHLMVAREAPPTRTRVGSTLEAAGNRFLQKVLFEHRAVFLPDTAEQPEWRAIPLFDSTRSWLGIPLLAGGTVLGILSLGSGVPQAFTMEHLRLAKSLAVPAAVAVQNARAHERAEICATELQVSLEQLQQARRALEHAASKATQNPGG